MSKLLERVALGEDIVIAKAGKPVARQVTVLLDTPAVLWTITAYPRLSPVAHRLFLPLVTGDAPLRQYAVETLW